MTEESKAKGSVQWCKGDDSRGGVRSEGEEFAKPWHPTMRERNREDIGSITGSKAEFSRDGARNDRDECGKVVGHARMERFLI